MSARSPAPDALKAAFGRAFPGACIVFPYSCRGRFHNFGEPAILQRKATLVQSATDNRLPGSLYRFVAPWRVVGDHTSLLTCLIFESGFPTLLYQLAWQRSASTSKP
jgi:hypothetical protein